MKIFCLLHLFKVFHPECYNVSGNCSIAECRAKDLNEAIDIFRKCFPCLNELGYFKKDDISSYCIAEQY